MSNSIGGSPQSQGVTVQDISNQYYNTELRLTPDERALVLTHRAAQAEREERTVILIADAVASVLGKKTVDYIPDWPGTRSIAITVRNALRAEGLLKE